MMGDTVEEISKRPEIRKELERATGEKRREEVKPAGRDKYWFVVHAIVLGLCAAVYFVLGAKIIPLPEAGIGIAQRILRGAVLITIVLAVARAISVYGLARIEDASTRFTLQRIAHLVAALGIAVIVVSIIFVNWYAAVAAFGVGSIIIGLAVQTPMKSFIAWIYILVRQPFRVGDRIQIGDATGDVIDVGYLDTRKSARRTHLQLLVAAFSIHLERGEVPSRLQRRPRVHREDDAKNHRGRIGPGNDRTRRNLSRLARPHASGRIGGARASTRDFSSWRKYMVGSDCSLPGCSARSRARQNSVDQKTPRRA